MRMMGFQVFDTLLQLFAFKCQHSASLKGFIGAMEERVIVRRQYLLGILRFSLELLKLVRISLFLHIILMLFHFLFLLLFLLFSPVG